MVAEERVLRFNRTERAVHWVQAISFLVLLCTGFALALPQIEAVLGNRALLREIHLMAAFFLAFGPGIVALAGDRRSIGQDIEAVDHWDSDDVLWLSPVGQERPQGRFNAGQKLNALFVVWATATFVVTGLVMWQNRRFPLDLVQRANSIHTTLAYVALVAFLGHLFLATVWPSTRHALHAITQGWVRREWAEHHHPKWIRRMAPPSPPPSHDALRFVVQTLLGSAAALLFVRLLFFWIGANVTDKVTGMLYALTAWPGVAAIAPHTGVRVVDWPALVYLVVVVVAWLAADHLRRAAPDEKRDLAPHVETASLA